MMLSGLMMMSFLIRTSLGSFFDSVCGDALCCSDGSLAYWAFECALVEAIDPLCGACRLLMLCVAIAARASFYPEDRS